MRYSAIWDNRHTLAYHPRLLDGEKDLFPEICPDMPDLRNMISVREPEGLSYWLDAVDNRAVCGFAETGNTIE